MSSEREYTDRLAGGGYDLILSDYNLPGFSGIAALMLARKLQPDVPFICISGTIGEDMAVELIQLGASDYILKDRPSRLPVAIERAFNDTKLEKAKEKAEADLLNMKDSLEMLNRRLDEIRENERASISREIHDHLGQSLTALKIDIQHIRDKMTEGSGDYMKLEAMNRLVTEMIRDVQRIAAELRPPILDDLGLVSAMEWYIQEFGKRTGIACRHRLGPLQFPDKQRNLTMYRILQEALTNVSRHASASTVSVDLSVMGNIAVMTVRDNGIGFDESKIRSFQSLGFLGIRERLKQTGGHLDIESAPGKGTRLSVSIPVD